MIAGPAAALAAAMAAPQQAADPRAKAQELFDSIPEPWRRHPATYITLRCTTCGQRWYGHLRAASDPGEATGRAFEGRATPPASTSSLFRALQKAVRSGGKRETTSRS